MSLKEKIFEPKYGGKDHSGYDTLMKYEVNEYLVESFERGFDACQSEYAKREEIYKELVDKMKAALEFYKSYVHVSGLSKANYHAAETLTDVAEIEKGLG